MIDRAEQQRVFPRRGHRRGTTRSRNSLLRLFGSSRELLGESNADLRRLLDALSSSKPREAMWALMDTAITVFHIGDWIRTTHVGHGVTSKQFAQDSKWIRMTRGLCHAAKHVDLTREDSRAAVPNCHEAVSWGSSHRSECGARRSADVDRPSCASGQAPEEPPRAADQAST